MWWWWAGTCIIICTRQPFTVQSEQDSHIQSVQHNHLHLYTTMLNLHKTTTTDQSVKHNQDWSFCTRQPCFVCTRQPSNNNIQMRARFYNNIQKLSAWLFKSESLQCTLICYAFQQEMVHTLPMDNYDYLAKLWVEMNPIRPLACFNMAMVWVDR